MPRFAPFLFCIAASVSAQALVLQQERPIAPVRMGLASPSQRYPATATDGTTVLVWLDDRNTLPAKAYATDDGLLVMAALVDRQGKVLDNPNLVLPLHGRVLPFWNGSEYVVVSAGQYVRISSAGELLDAVPRTFECSLKEVRSLAWSGERLLLVGDRGVLYDASFRVLRDGIPVNSYSYFSLASNWSGRNYVLLSIEGSGTHFARVSSDGQRVDLQPGLGFGPALDIPFGTSSRCVNCGTDGCFQYEIQDETIVATRFDDTASGLVVGSKPVARADGSLSWQQMIVFGDALKKNVAYLRLAPEAPYAGTWHLFIRSTAVPRGKAVHLTR